MKLVKNTKEHSIYKKENGRHAVKAQGKWINGEAKVAVLVKAGILKHPSKKKEAAAEEKPAET